MNVPSQNPERFPWRLFWLLIAVTILSLLAVIPLASEMIGAMLTKVGPLPIPLPLLVLIGVVQNVAILALVVGLGLKLSRSLGLRAPLLESWIYGKTESNARPGPAFKSGLFTGAAVGIVVLLSLLVLVPRLPNLPLVIVARLPVWKRFLLCFYGGVYEEMLTRLFLLALVAWIANRSWRKTAPQLPASVFWFANIFTAILFGLGHLPSASLFMTITPLVVVAALLLNGIAGIAFGYLYRKRGLESAMIAHFTADFVIYVVGASLLRS